MSYPFEMTVEVIFRDIDALGHTNNAVYLTYTESARLKYFTELMNIKGLADWPLILAEVTCTYKSPTYLGELLRIGGGVTRIGTSSFYMAFTVTAERDGRLVALVRNVLVYYDYVAGRSVPLPDAFRAAVAARQGNWVA